MSAIPANYDLTALCLWREARGEGVTGMQAVANVIVNRANKRKLTCDQIVVQPMQFSSMTAPEDPQLHLYPNGADPTWQAAQMLAKGAKAHSLADITHGSTLYYSPKSMTGRDVAPTCILINGQERVFPKGWNRAKVQFQAAIGNSLFFTEVA